MARVAASERFRAELDEALAVSVRTRIRWRRSAASVRG